MWKFAWRNLATRPLRTILALVGLSIPILGVLGLFSLSGGLRNLVGDTLGRIQGVVVLREGVPSPVASDLPADMAEELRKLPDVTAVAPEVWRIAPSVEGRSAFSRAAKSIASGLTGKKEDAGGQFMSILDQPVIQGQDIPSHKNLKSAIFPRHMLPPNEGGGRFLQDQDHGKNRVVISTKLAKDNADPKTKVPRKVGDSIDIGGEKFEIIGIYSTGSIFLDVVMIMDIDTARRLTNVNKETVSTFYVEGRDPGKNSELVQEIHKRFPKVNARSANEILADFGDLMNQLDLFLFATVMLALIVGVVGIVNTMLMSTTERFAEFGVLRTNGWSRANVLALVTTESAYLGLLSGLLGFLLALIFATVANQFIASSGLSLQITPLNAAQGLGLAVVMGTIGGLYPAWKASRLVPMDAIRLGAR